MTRPQVIYLIAVAAYVMLFLMFSRFFLWKRYSERRYWRKRPFLTQAILSDIAKEKGKKLPFFSILVPARNEAQVIEKTIRHMVALNYPKDSYEVIVVTDEKESTESQRQKSGIVSSAMDFLQSGLAGHRQHPSAEQKTMAMGILSELAIQEYRAADVNEHAWLMPVALTRDDSWRCRDIILTLTQDLLESKGRLHIGRLYCLLRRAFPSSSDKEIARLYPNYLCLALPVIAAFSELTGQHSDRYLHSIIKCTTQANHKVTQDLLTSFTNLVTRKVLAVLRQKLAAAELASMCEGLYTYCFPTTQTVLERVQNQLSGTDPVVKHVEVPYDYDGLFPGRCTGELVPSTKGRALNYALSRVISERTDVCGFYDAESRPQPDVLLYVAQKHLTNPGTVRIWQGPVFQVRNFYEMGPFSKIASLYQAIAHDWYLPVVFRRLPFVGGTNLYVEYQLLKDLGGYDHQSLTEDLELGTRAYLATGAWPEYLPYASSEQTPTSFKSFYKQRLRWGTGHLQVMDKVRSSQGFPGERKRRLMRELSIKGPIEWAFYQAVTLLPPAMLLLYWTGNVDPSVLPSFIRVMLNFLSLVYIGFTFYAFYRYYGHLDRTSRPLTWYGNIGVGAQLCFLPLAAFFFPVPYTSALVLKALGKHPTTWTKTPRTRE